MRWLKSIYTDGTEWFVTPHYPKLNQEVIIRLRVFKKNPVLKIEIRIAPEGEPIYFPLELEHEDNIFSWYQIKIRMVSKILSYRFRLFTKDSIYWYNAAGIKKINPSDQLNFKILADLQVPEWLPSRIFYQIFPDTFCRAKKDIDSSLWDYSYNNKKVIIRNWNELPGKYQECQSMDFFAGDLAGIRSKISYLKELGVNAIYFTPIFQAPSNHRYDTQDYFLIDPKLGTNEEFCELMKEFHNENIRVILDGVFNHSGIAIRWFNKSGFYQEAGAYQSLDSEYAEFYTFYKHPEDYASWLNLVKTLPKLNYRSSKLRDTIYRKENSVMQFWMQEPYNIDGWRLDVANMLARQDDYQAHCEVYQEMRKSLKNKFPQSYIMGESFFDGTELLQGDMLDAIMNYWGFCLPLRDWLAGIHIKDGNNKLTQNYVYELDAKDMALQMQEAQSRIPWQIAEMQYNLVNCHDLPRIVSLAQKSSYNKLAATMVLTFLGIPSIYYGDEIGLGSPESTTEGTRCPMPWDQQKWDMPLLEFYQKLIQLRKNSQALLHGSIKFLYTKGDIFSYARFLQDEIVVIILNRGCQIKITLETNLLGVEKGQEFANFFQKEHSIFADNDGDLKIVVPKESSMILYWKK